MDDFKAGFVVYASKDKKAHKEAFDNHIELVDTINPWLCVNIVDSRILANGAYPGVISSFCPPIYTCVANDTSIVTYSACTYVPRFFWTHANRTLHVLHLKTYNPLYVFQFTFLMSHENRFKTIRAMYSL